MIGIDEGPPQLRRPQDVIEQCDWGNRFANHAIGPGIARVGDPRVLGISRENHDRDEAQIAVPMPAYPSHQGRQFDVGQQAFRDEKMKAAAFQQLLCFLAGRNDDQFENAEAPQDLPDNACRIAVGFDHQRRYPGKVEALFHAEGPVLVWERVLKQTV